MIQSEGNSNSSKAIVEAINLLQAKPSIESLEKFMSKAGPQIELNPAYKLIAAKAKIVLGLGDPATYEFLFNYFKEDGNTYAAICCVEALLLEDENTAVTNKHAELMAIYNSRKEKELALIRNTFIENPPDKTISIIMPTYNRHQYIKQAITSILNQTFRDFEIIVVNDGGSRECEAIIDSFKSDKIRYLYVEHGGLSHALNEGVLASRSKYIAYLDDDDQYYPDHLQSLVSAIELSNSFVYTDAYCEVKMYEDEKWTTKAKTVEFSSDFDFVSLSENNYIPILCMAHRRDCFEQTGLFERELPNAMDWDLWIKASRLYEFKHLEKVTCIYEFRLGPDSLSGRQLDNIFFSDIVRTHHWYLAKQAWTELCVRGDLCHINYTEIAKRCRLYCKTEGQIVELLLHFAFTKGEYYNVFLFIAKLTRQHPRRTFFILRSLSHEISVLGRLYSFFVFFLSAVEYTIKHLPRKTPMILTILLIPAFVIFYWSILLSSMIVMLGRRNN